ncbi:MAG: VWA domain-containing protein [Blastocatellia bacterium]|nr:VWA domain-containing protein [Blastocatellia bacterium]
MKSRIVASIVALALFILFGGLKCAGFAQETPYLQRDFTETFNAIIIENPGGPVEVQTWPSASVRVIAAIESRSYVAGTGPGVSFDNPYSGALRVKAQKDASVSLTVYIPAHVTLSVKGGNHPVIIKGATVGTSAETVSGDISLHLPDDSNSDISARAFEGAISSKLPVTIFGPIDAHTIDGRIGAGGAPVILRSLRGRINLLPDASSRISEIGRILPGVPEDLRVDFGTPAQNDSGKASASTGSSIVSNGFSRGRFDESGRGKTGDPSSNQPDVDAIKLETRLVNLNVKVWDISGRSITDLTKEDFQVFEDGERQDITHFAPITAPVSLVLLLDLSGSTKDKMKAMKKAAQKFVDSLNRSDRIAVAAFNRRFMVVSHFTTDRKLLKDRIDDMKNRSGGTGYYDAMWDTLDLFNETNETRRAIVVLTDGVDNSISDPEDYQPRHPYDELLTRIAQEEATIYPIYFDTEYETVVKGGMGNHQEYVIARKQLHEVADFTGGLLFKANRIEDLEGVYQRVAAELHSLYSIAYSAKSTRKDGQWRNISVKVHRDKATARTKKGYYAR